MSAPRPQTLVAFLPSQGYRTPRATLHKYLETREFHITDKNGKKEKDGAAYEYIYICQETGETRRWGTAHRVLPTWEKDGN